LTDAGEHGRSAKIDHSFFRKRGDVACRVVQRDERSAVGQLYRIVKLALPTSVIIRRKASDRGIRKFDWDGSLLRLIVQRE